MSRRFGFSATVIDKNRREGWFSTKFTVVMRFEDEGLSPRVKEMPVTAEQYYDMTMGGKYTVYLYEHRDGNLYTYPETL
jgi:hypothetical protein